MAGEDANVVAVPHWHAAPTDDVLALLDAPPDGLSHDEARERLAVHGPNALPAAPRRHPLQRLLAQFDNALIVFLLAAAAAAALLGHFGDAAVIVGVVLVNAAVGFLQEGKAEKALAAIGRLASSHAAVLREGRRHGVAVHELVPGDSVLLEAGDRVPADLRLLRAHGLLIDEALLTGESVAAPKKTEPAAADADLADRHSMAYSGTLVAAGQAAGVVVATGANTQIGRIGTLLHAVEPLTTPLLRQIDRFSRRFTLFALVGAALLFAFAVGVRGYAWPQALMAVVALAVGAIPEGLPAVITVTLAIGVQRMAARKAVIRRLPAVETLGATSVICSDKTGTLTRNEMTARCVLAGWHRVEVGGAGYAPQGELRAVGTDDDAAAVAAVAPLLRCAVLCNDAQLHGDESGWTVHGDPMEGALLVLATKAGLDPQHVRGEWPRVDALPFDASHRLMATLHDGPTGEAMVFVKGAPEQLLMMAAVQEGDPHRPLDRDYWVRRIAEAARDGERVLGFACRRYDADRRRVGLDDLREGLVWLGLVGLIDPPRDEARAAVAQCHAAGIDVKMITGDHAATAAAIAAQLGLADEPTAATGAQIDAAGDTELAALVRRTAVFARTSPEHKLRIVRALQAQGAVVAMTGDGVNDAPALKQADVGVAMGIKGTEAAKEAAEMVLLDDNFASIVGAVHEGRTVHDNIRKVIAWTLPTNGGEALTVIAALLFGLALPMSAAQILWVNLVTSVTLGLVLAFEPPEADVMSRPPRDAEAPLLSPFLLWRVGIVSALFMAVSLGVYEFALRRGSDVETARTLVVNTLTVLAVFYLFNVRYLRSRSITLRGALGTRPVLLAIAVVVVAQLAFTYLPVMNAWFDTRPVALADGALIVMLGAALMLVLEAEKALLRRLGAFEELSG